MGEAGNKHGIEQRIMETFGQENWRKRTALCCYTSTPPYVILVLYCVKNRKNFAFAFWTTELGFRYSTEQLLQKWWMVPCCCVCKSHLYYLLVYKT